MAEEYAAMQEARTPFVTGPLTGSQDTLTDLPRDGARRANLVGPVSFRCHETMSGLSVSLIQLNTL